MWPRLQALWRVVRQLSGDDAYERYLLAFAQQHRGEAACEHTHAPLSRQAFFKQWQDGKWQGIKRCC